jgi:iron(III) transport system permease protein
MLIVAFLVLVPLIVMIAATFRPAGVFPLESGEFTLTNYTEFLSGQRGVWKIFQNTFIYAGGTMALAVPMAFGMAFLTERTDVPFRSVLYTLMFVPFVTPVFATALGWVLLAGPRAGAVNEYIRLIFGLESRNGPFNIYTMEGMIFVTALGIVPSMWLLLVSVLRNMDPTLEEAASTAGVNRWGVLRKVTIPLMLPGILAVVIYFSIAVIESFEIPLALGITAGVQVLSTKIFLIITSVDEGRFAYGSAAVYGMVGVIIGVIGISAYMWLIRRSSRYTVITGKGYRPRKIKLGRWKYVAFGLIGLYMFIKVLMPFSMILYASFLRYYVPPLPENFWPLGQIPWTLENYRNLWDWRFFGRTVWNTAIVVFAAASVTMLLVTVVAWAAVRLKTPVAHTANVLTFMPLAIPGVIMTLAFFLLFIGTPLFGTLALIVLAFTARYLAYSTRLMYSAQVQVHKELEEASLVSGVGHVPTLVFINLRLLLPAFINGWLWIVTHAAKDFTTPLLLATSGTVLVANVIYSRFEGGRFTESAAVMVVLVIMLITVVFAGRRFLGGEVKQ